MYEIMYMNYIHYIEYSGFAINMFSFLQSVRPATAVCQAQTTYPNPTPVIYSLSQYSSAAGAYSVVYIYGENFLCNQDTSSTGQLTNVYMSIVPNGLASALKNPISVTFYNSNEISFVVPSSFSSGVYKLVVGVKSNVNGGNGSTMAAPTYLLFSNSVNYSIV